jgi:hypothetical protein
LNTVIPARNSHGNLESEIFLPKSGAAEVLAEPGEPILQIRVGFVRAVALQKAKRKQLSRIGEAVDSRTITRDKFCRVLHRCQNQNLRLAFELPT